MNVIDFIGEGTYVRSVPYVNFISRYVPFVCLTFLRQSQHVLCDFPLPTEETFFSYPVLSFLFVLSLHPDGIVFHFPDVCVQGFVFISLYIYVGTTYVQHTGEDIFFRDSVYSHESCFDKNLIEGIYSNRISNWYNNQPSPRLFGEGICEVMREE